MSNQLTPKDTVDALNRFIVGQVNAKRAVAIALRNRWRRKRLDSALREEVSPKNILMIGPTGVGKTEIARRLAKLVEAPFIKVDATKFTEVGYVGRDVEQIIRDLVEIALRSVREKMEAKMRSKACEKAKGIVLKHFVGSNPSEETRAKFADMLDKGELKDKEIEIEVCEQKKPIFDIPGMPMGQMGMFDLNDLTGAKRKKRRKLPVSEAMDVLIQEELALLLDDDDLTQMAIKDVEENGIVFIDEIDKICIEEGRSSGSISREGVQRDLLPIVEGTSVNTKYGPVKTDYILFIASGAFHVSKPSDLLPELQGRLPNRVEMSTLTEEEFYRILTEPEANLIHQYTALLATEGVTLTFSECGVRCIAHMACCLNDLVENIGARRLHTLMERVLSDVSFEAPVLSGQSIAIDSKYVQDKVGSVISDADLTKFIL